MAARPPGAVTGETGVVSVSPGHANPDVREVFLSPRVVDQHAFDDLAGTLRGLIDQADAATRQLEERQQWFASNAGEPAQAAARLQERLRLSAQMLKAFQTQIDRVESTLETLDTSAATSEEASAQLQQRLDGFQAGLHERQRAMEAALESVADDILTRFKDSARGTLPSLDTHARVLEKRRAAAVASLDQALQKRVARQQAAHTRLESIETRVGEMADALEQAEVQSAAITGRIGQARKDLERHATESRSLTERADATRESLARLLEHAEHTCDRMERDAGRTADTLDARLARCERLESRLGAMLERLEPAAATSARLEAMLDRLEPWSALLLESEPADDGTPAPVATMLDALRTTVESELGQLAETMRSFAARLDETLPARDQAALPEIVTRRDADDAQRLRLSDAGL